MSSPPPERVSKPVPLEPALVQLPVFLVGNVLRPIELPEHGCVEGGCDTTGDPPRCTIPADTGTAARTTRDRVRSAVIFLMIFPSFPFLFLFSVFLSV